MEHSLRRSAAIPEISTVAAATPPARASTEAVRKEREIKKKEVPPIRCVPHILRDNGAMKKYKMKRVRLVSNISKDVSSLLKANNHTEE